MAMVFELELSIDHTAAMPCWCIRLLNSPLELSLHVFNEDLAIVCKSAEGVERRQMMLGRGRGGGGAAWLFMLGSIGSGGNEERRGERA